MNKLIKIGATFLLSICCLTPINVNATDIITDYGIEPCEDGYICTYKLDENLNKYMISDMGEENEEVNLFTDSGTDTIQPTWNMYYNNGSWTKLTTVTSGAKYGAISNVSGILFNADTLYVSGEYISYTFNIGFSNSDFLQNISEIYVNGIKVNEFSMSSTSISLTGTNNSINSTGTFSISIYYSNNISVRSGSITNFNATLSKDTNGATNQSLSAMNNTLLFIYSYLNTELNTILNSINSNTGSINSMIETSIAPLLSNIKTSIDSLTTNMNTKLEDICVRIMADIDNNTDRIRGYFENLFLKIEDQTTRIRGYFENLIKVVNGNGVIIESKPNVQDTTNQFEDSMNEYNDIESGIVDDFKTNLDNISLNNDLYQNNDFLNTGTFIATQMTRIYNSNDVVRMMITYGMIVGLAFTIIGISVKR